MDEPEDSLGAPAFPDPTPAGRGLPWLAWPVTFLVWALLAAFFVKVGLWGRGGREARGPKAEGQRMVVVDLMNVPSLPAALERRAAESAANGLGSTLPRTPGSGGARGSGRAQAPEPQDPFQSLPARGDGGVLADLEPRAIPGPAPQSLAGASVAGRPGSSGAGHGQGEGAGAGPGKGPKGGYRRADLVALAAKAEVLRELEYGIARKVVPRYVMGSHDPESLYTSVVRMRVLVDADGVPLLCEVLFGPRELQAVATEAARGYRFIFAPSVRAKAPVVVLLRFVFHKGRAS
jgi:hypothetical protein